MKTLCLSFLILLAGNISQSQPISKQDLDEYILQCNSDSVEVVQIGIIRDELVYVFGKESDDISYWDIKIISDTTWYNSGEAYVEDNPNRHRILYRKIYKRKEPSFKEFKKWLDNKDD